MFEGFGGVEGFGCLEGNSGFGESDEFVIET